MNTQANTPANTRASDFRKEFRAAPVPIRMSTAFSKKTDLNFHARAISCTQRTLRVLSVSPFESGVQLSITAPFLDGSPGCRVVGVKRILGDEKGFEVELRFTEPPVPVTVAVPPVAQLVGAAAQEKLPAPQQQAPLRVEEIAAAAAVLGRELESSLEVPYAKAFSRMDVRTSAPERQLRLLATIAATMLLLQEKRLADGSSLLESLEQDLKLNQ